MLDRDRTSEKAPNSFKSSSNTGRDSPNNVLLGSDVEEDFDNGFPGPSTSNYDEAIVDDLSYYTEDLGPKEHGNARQLFSELRQLLDNDSVFHRIRSELLSDLNRIAQEHQSLNSEQLSHRQRFEFLERLEDILDTTNDLNEAHLAVLRHVALQLSNHAPLEVMGSDFDLEHLFVVPEKQKRNGVEEEAVSPPKKTRKSKNVDGSKLSVLTSQRVQQNIETNLGKTAKQAVTNDGESVKVGSREAKEGMATREARANVASSGSDKVNGRLDLAASSSKLAEYENATNEGRTLNELVEAKSDDQSANGNKNASSSLKFDSENSLTDAKEAKSTEKMKKLDAKKSFKKPNAGKPNGITKPTKSEKLGGSRRASERQGNKPSRTPEPEPKKPKRRTTAAAESSNESTGRVATQRRTTRNTQQNSELSNIDEQTYCLCDQISYGQMICCDNSSCKIEWYHFECVGLKIKPGKGQKWFCPACRGDKSTVMRSTLRR